MSEEEYDQDEQDEDEPGLGVREPIKPKSSPGGAEAKPERELVAV